MYYMISPIPFEDYKKFHVPFRDDDKYHRDYNNWYETEQGKEFRSIEPVRISCENSKNQMLWEIAMDIFYFGSCYNCPLHVYIMKDKVFYKELDLGHARWTNIGKCKAIEAPHEERDFSACLPRKEMYFEGQMAVVEKQVYDVMKFKLTNDKPIAHYIVYKNKIEVCDD